MKLRKFKNLVALSTLAVLSLVSGTRGVCDSDNFTPLADSEINNADADSNFSSGLTVVSGKLNNGSIRRCFYRFDLSTIPTNATVTSASVTVSVDKVPSGGGADSTFDLRRVLKSWTETNVTWNTPWTTPGASHSSDASSTGSSSAAVTAAALGPVDFPSTPNLIADVRLWITNSSANFGWLLISQDEVTLKTARRFGAKEDPSTAPVLTINYTLPPAPVNTNFTIVNLAASGNQFQFSFYADSNKTYTVESLANLSTTNWVAVTSYPASTAAAVQVFTNALTSSNRFYRVKTP